jgi:hypothetical protein
VTGDTAVVVDGAVGVETGSSILVLGSGLLAEAARAPTPAPAAAPATMGAAPDSYSGSAREVKGVLAVGAGADEPATAGAGAADGWACAV